MNIMTCSSPSRSCYLFPPIYLSLSLLLATFTSLLDDSCERIVVGRKFLVERLINFRVARVSLEIGGRSGALFYRAYIRVARRANDHNSTVTRNRHLYRGGRRGAIGEGSRSSKSGSKMDATSASNGRAHYVPVIRGSSNIRGRLRTYTRAIRNKASRLSGACHYRRMIKSIIDAKHARRRSSNQEVGPVSGINRHRS